MTKRFGGINALDAVSFTVHAGEVVGLIGPNGSGKTTLMSSLAGLTPVDAGALTDGDGHTLQLTATDRRLFFLPDGISPWPDQRVDWFLDFVATLLGSDPSLVARVHAVFGIDALRSQRLGELSKGQRKRVLLAATLCVPRPLLLLDEPFDGLDFRQTREAMALVRDIASTGRTILLSIHSTGDAERVCDRLVLLSDGRVIGDGTLDDLRQRVGRADANLEEVFLALA